MNQCFCFLDQILKYNILAERPLSTIHLDIHIKTDQTMIHLPLHPHTSKI